MPTLNQSFNWGSSLRNENPELNRQLSIAYEAIAQVVNTKISKYTTDGILKPHVNPPASSDFNKNFDVADVYVRTDTNTAWMMTSRTTAIDAVWTQIT